MKSLEEYIKEDSKFIASSPKRIKTYKTVDKIFKKLTDDGMDAAELQDIKKDMQDICTKLNIPETCSSCKLYGDKDLKQEWENIPLTPKKFQNLWFKGTDLYPNSFLYFIDHIYEPVKYNGSIILKYDMSIGGSAYIEIK